MNRPSRIAALFAAALAHVQALPAQDVPPDSDSLVSTAEQATDGTSPTDGTDETQDGIPVTGAPPPPPAIVESLPPPDAGPGAETPPAAEPPGPVPPASPASETTPEAPPAGNPFRQVTEAPAPQAPVPPAPVHVAEPEPLAAPGERPSPGVDLPELLRSHWRAAVADGRTELGFGEWLAFEIGAGGGGDGTEPAPRTQEERTRAASLAWGTRAGPVAMGEAGRVVTVFGAAIPRAMCSPLTVCLIQLEPGEVLTDTPSWGDTARWQVVAKVQGSDPETVVLEVKPAADAEDTNLVIPTDRRLYTISLANDPAVHTPILSFTYPDSAARESSARAAARREAREREARATAVATKKTLARTGVETRKGTVAADRLDFGFGIEGKAKFRPVRVFTDGSATYIDLHPEYRGAIPAVIAAEGEDNAPLNTRVTRNGTRIVADRVVSDIWLQAGSRRVRIWRDGE